jgi:hypothetical protein
MSAFSRAEDQYYDYDRYMSNLDCEEGCKCDDCTARGEDDDD